MLPKALLPSSARGPYVRPRYLREDDHPWLRALLDVYRAHADEPRRVLDDRLREPLAIDGPSDKRARAIHVLDRLCRQRVRAAVSPRRARAALFVEAARTASRDDAIARAASALDVEPAVVTECLFADLPGERRLCAPPEDLDPGALALRTNLALVQGLVAASSRLTIRAHGNARDLVRYARLRGLLTNVRPLEGGGAQIELSGPFALFRHTLVYGRALASLVPRLPWCADFSLEADYLLDGEPRQLVVSPGDPIFPAREPKRFDSKLEARFARDFEKAAPDWELVREPRPIRSGDALIFVDFELVHRRHADRRWLLEIVGFWTESYLATKMQRLERARLDRLVLCVDAERASGRDDLPEGARVVPFRRRIDVADVLRVIEETTRPLPQHRGAVIDEEAS